MLVIQVSFILQNEFNRISKVYYSCFGIEIGISSLKKGKKWYEKNANIWKLYD